MQKTLLRCSGTFQNGQPNAHLPGLRHSAGTGKHRRFHGGTGENRQHHSPQPPELKQQSRGAEPTVPPMAQKGNSMKILIVEPGKHPREAEIDGSLESMQKTVSGYLQAIYPFEDEVALVCDDESKLKSDMQWNKLNFSFLHKNKPIRGNVGLALIDVFQFITNC